MKQITYDLELMTKIKAGVDKLVNAVKTTLGPGGSNVILDISRGAHITKDGVTVANFISLEDPIENVGAQVVKEAASRTANLAGDGTTTATVLAQAILTQGIKNVTAGANRIDLKRGIDMATIAIVNELKNLSRPVGDGDIRNVALISANGDSQVADVITDAIDKVTKDGLVIVQDSRSTITEVQVVEGMTFERGWLNVNFVNNQEEATVEYDDPVILLIDYVIEEFVALIRLLNMIKSQMPERPVVIIAEDVRGNALSTMAMNNVRGIMQMAAVQSPDHGEMRKETFRDIAALTGAKIITKDAGMTANNVGTEVCGTCKRIRISQWKTTILGGLDVTDRLNLIEVQMEDANDNALVKLKERYARLAGRVGIIFVGGNSEIEIKEKKDRIDDALQATRAAIEEGILPGGGVAYVRALSAVREGARPEGFDPSNDDQLQGTEILFRAILEPIKSIAENVGVNGEVVLNSITTNRYDPISYGFNAKTQKYEDLIAAGVIDPTKVTRLALENAASVAGMLLTTKAIVTNAPDQRNGK
jgi:chaperonin GroEL